MESDEKRGSRYLIDILVVMDQVIDCLRKTYRNPQNPSEISRCIGVTRSRVFRVLKSLQELGYVDGYKNGYTLGYKFLDIGETIRSELDGYQKAKTVMSDLASSTGDAVFMYAWTGNTAVCIANAVGENRLQVGKHIGEHIPLYIGGAPLVLLAYIPKDDQHRIITEQTLTPLTNRTIQSKDELFRRLAQIHQNGYDIDQEEYEIGVCGIGAPIFDRGDIVGALSLEIPSPRFDQENRDIFMKMVVDAAQSISVIYNKMAFEDQNSLTKPKFVI